MATSARFDIGTAAVDPAIITHIFPPVADGITGYWRTRSAYVANGQVANLVNPTLPGLIVGAPTIEAGGMLCKGGTNFINSQLMSTEAQTFIALGRQTVATERPGIMGSYTNVGTPVRGEMLYGNAGSTSPAANIGMNACYSTDGGATSNLVTSSRLAADVLSDICVAAVWTPGVGITVYDLTRDVSQATANVNPRLLHLTNTIRIGSVYHSTYTGFWYSKCAAVFARALSKAELMTMRDYLVTNAA
jgi:hypothetical protein